MNGQSTVEMATDSQWKEGQLADRRTAGGRNDDRQLAEKQGRVSRRTDRQMVGRGINGDGQSVDDEKTKVDKLTDGQTDW